MKRMLSLFLTICLMVGIVGALPVQAADNFEEEYGISYNDLFMKYPSYLRNATSEEIIRNATDAYNDVIAKYDENDELISALKSGASEGLDVIIKNIGSALGLTDSYYEECMDKATMAFMQEVYSDEDSVADLAFIKESAKQFKWIKTATDLSTASIDIAASNMKNLSRDQVETITKTIKGNYSKVLDPATDMVDLAKYIYTACVIEDVQIEMIDLLLEKTDKEGELYKGLTRLHNDMTGGIAQYTLSAFIENKLLSEISSTIMKFGWNALDISTGSIVIGKLIMKTAVWVLFDIIFPHPDADTTISNMILTAYVNEICVVLINKRSVFDSPFFVSDMEDYRTLYTMYLSCINATMDSTMALAETTEDEAALSSAKNTFNVALPDFDTYISYCMDVLSTTPAADRIQRTITTSDYITVSSGTVIVGSFDEDVDNTDALPLTSENTTLWNVSVTRGTLIAGNNVIIPELQVNGGTLNVKGGLNIEYDLSQSGNIELNGGSIIVGWNYTNDGTLSMKNDTDYILVHGDYSQKSSSSNDITAGVLEIKGNMVECGGYNPTGTHKTLLSGKSAQSVYLCSYDLFSTYDGSFNILELANTSEEGITFSRNAENGKVKKELIVHDGVVLNDSQKLALSGTASVRGGVCDFDICLDDWTDDNDIVFNKDVYIEGLATFNKPHTIGGKIELPDYEYGNLIVNNELTINGDLKNCESITQNAVINVKGNVYQYGDHNANADMNITGDFTHSGNFVLNNAKLTVGGNYSNGGYLDMQHNDDYVLVNGDYIHNQSSSGGITAGVLEIKGNMVECGGYNPTGTHKTLLSGKSAQSVYLCSYDLFSTYDGSFNILELANTSEEGITFSRNAENGKVKKELIVHDGVVLNDSQKLALSGTASVRGGVCDFDICLDDWTDDNDIVFNKDVYIEGLATFNKPHTIGGKIELPDYEYGNLIVNNELTINGDLKNCESITQNAVINVKGNVYQYGDHNANADMNITGDFTHSGNFVLNNAKLTVGGNYSNGGYLDMQHNDDYVLVNGDYIHNQSSSGGITAGVLEIKGNMVECGGYNPTGTHKTILSSIAHQTIGMSYYGGWSSVTGTFNILEIKNTAPDGITFTSSYTNVKSNILQPIGTPLKNSNYLYIQEIAAFKDCGELNSAINIYNNNAESVIPTWVDYENYSASNVKVTGVTVNGLDAESIEDKWNIMMPYGTASVVKEQIIVNTEDEAAAYEINSSDVPDTWIITVTSKNGLESKEYTLNISYDPVNHVSGIYMDKTEAAINVGEELSLTVSFMPEDATYKTLTWKSSNENVAKVEDGIVTAINKGTTTITAISNNGLETTCEVTVLKPSTAIRLNKSKVSLGVSESLQLSTIMTPADSTDLISWSSSNENIAKVTEKGLVSAISAGNVIITATTTSGASARCNINIYDSSNEVTSVTISENEIYLAPNDAKQLVVNVLPEDAVDAVVTWSSSNEDVAVVDESGMVTAVANGITIIKAMTANGIYDECVVKVVSVSDASVLLTSEKASPNGTVQVKASLVKNPGISGYKFTVNYDDTILTPVAVTPNSEFGGSLATNLDDDNRVGLNIAWYTNEDVDVNGELFTIVFKVSDSAEYGDTSSVSIEYGAKDICNTAGEYFALYIDDATISIEEPIPGNIYEDDEVTIYDLTLLSRYITSLETFTARQKEAADVNNDNLVNVLDVIKMAQYLTGWSNIELMSVGLFSLRESAAPVISVGSASVNSANEAEIPVYIKSNTGIAAYRFILDYNAEDIEILSITPSELIIKENFNHNLGAVSQAEDGLIVTSRTSGGNVTEDGVLFTIKVRYKNPTDTSVSPISIRDIFDNMGNEGGTYVTATYETGYALGSDYIVANKVVGDTNFSCELYFDDSFAEQATKAIIVFYDADGRMVQLMPKDITVKPGKVDLSINFDKKAYATYKLMIWEGMNSLKPITDVK